MIDLRKEFEKIMRRWGHNVYLQRRIYDHRDDIPDEDKATTNFYEKKLEKFTVRYTFAGRKTALTSVAEERIEGIVHSSDRVYYFPYFANPGEGDRIYQHVPGTREVLDPDGKPVRKYSEIYLVDFALPLRGHNGRIEYWMAGATREEPS